MANGESYLAVWQPGSGAQYWVTGLNYNDFKAKDTAHFNAGLRLVSMRVQNGSFSGIWNPGSTCTCATAQRTTRTWPGM